MATTVTHQRPGQRGHWRGTITTFHFLRTGGRMSEEPVARLHGRTRRGFSCWFFLKIWSELSHLLRAFGFKDWQIEHDQKSCSSPKQNKQAMWEPHEHFPFLSDASQKLSNFLQKNERKVFSRVLVCPNMSILADHQKPFEGAAKSESYW